MMKMRVHAAVGAVAALAFLAACSDDVNPAGPGPDAAAAAAQGEDGIEPELARSPTGARSGARPERLSQRVSRQVPAFGGGFVEDGILHVHLTDVAAAAQARSVIGVEMRRGGRTDLTETRFVPARYSFRQLEDWHGRLASGRGIPHPLLYTEINERENRLAIGIESPDAEAPIRAVLARKGVPDEAVIFRVDVRPERLNHHLRDEVRPTRAGTQTRTTYSGAPNNFFCTHGPNVWYNSKRHFVTNSHCTQDVNVYGWGGYIGSVLHQPNTGPWYSPNRHRIGTEVRDPHFYHGWGCDSNQASHGCRWSDAALVENTITDWDFAGISRTIDRNFLPSRIGSLNINGTFPRIGLIDTWWWGDQLDKVGRTTGWTAGTVESTCRTVYLQSNVGTFGFICSGVVQASSGSGDSGSPVFQFTSSGTHLAGILFAGYINRYENVHGEWVYTGERFIFSRWDEVDWELGSWSGGGLIAAGNP